MAQVVKIGKKIVPVSFAEIIEHKSDLWKKVKEFVPFNDYCAKMDPRFTVEKITIQAIDMFGDRIGFMKIVASIKDEEGGFVPGSAFLRGGSVVMLLILRDENEQDYIILTQQPRSPVGKFDLLELPAGTLDGSRNFAGKAANEIKEELGITIHPTDLIDLTALAYGENAHGVYASPGGSDEAFRIFVCITKSDSVQIQLLDDRLSGLREKGEKITTQVIPLDGAWRKLPDAKSLAALSLYEMLKEKVERIIISKGGI